MAEGGIYPWKVQKIKQPENGLLRECRFADLSKPLPDPPKGQMWVQDQYREWKLVPVATATVDAVVVADTAGTGVDGDDGRVCTAVPVTVQAATAIVPNNTATGIRYHEVLPTDTFQGICLRYKVTPTELRRANRMMGSNLKLAPNPEKLIIPMNDKNQQLNTVSPTKEEQIASLLSKVRRITKNKLSYSEARAYLEVADWDMESAVKDVEEDFGWEQA